MRKAAPKLSIKFHKAQPQPSKEQYFLDCLARVFIGTRLYDRELATQHASSSASLSSFENDIFPKLECVKKPSIPRKVEYCGTSAPSSTLTCLLTQQLQMKKREIKAGAKKQKIFCIGATSRNSLQQLKLRV